MAVPAPFLTRWRVRLGYPVAIVFLFFAHPTISSIACGALLGSLGLLIRGAAAGFLYKHEGLATSGPYAHSRNPLYFGSALLAAGLLVAGRSWIAAIIVTAYFLGFYPGVMKREERELRLHYGREFDDYAARVPLFWPSFGAVSLGRSTRAFSWAQYKRNREYQALLGFAAVFAILSVLAFFPIPRFR